MSMKFLSIKTIFITYKEDYFVSSFDIFLENHTFIILVILVLFVTLIQIFLTPAHAQGVLKEIQIEVL